MTTAAMLGVVEEAVVSTAAALDAWMPPNWYAEKVKPLLAAFEALRNTRPLP